VNCVSCGVLMICNKNDCSERDHRCYYCRDAANIAAKKVAAGKSG